MEAPRSMNRRSAGEAATRYPLESQPAIRCEHQKFLESAAPHMIPMENGTQERHPLVRAIRIMALESRPLQRSLRRRHACTAFVGQDSPQWAQAQAGRQLQRQEVLGAVECWTVKAPETD